MNWINTAPSRRAHVAAATVGTAPPGPAFGGPDGRLQARLCPPYAAAKDARHRVSSRGPGGGFRRSPARRRQSAVMPAGSSTVNVYFKTTNLPGGPVTFFGNVVNGFNTASVSLGVIPVTTQLVVKGGSTSIPASQCSNAFSGQAYQVVPVAVDGQMAAAVNFGSSNVTIFVRQGNAMQPTQTIKTSAQPVSVAFGHDHLVVLETTAAESFAVYGKTVTTAADGNVSLQIGDGSAAQIITYAGGAVYTEKTGDIGQINKTQAEKCRRGLVQNA